MLGIAQLANRFGFRACKEDVGRCGQSASASTATPHAAPNKGSRDGHTEGARVPHLFAQRARLNGNGSFPRIFQTLTKADVPIARALGLERRVAKFPSKHPNPCLLAHDARQLVATLFIALGAKADLGLGPCDPPRNSIINARACLRGSPVSKVQSSSCSALLSPML